MRLGLRVLHRSLGFVEPWQSRKGGQWWSSDPGDWKNPSLSEEQLLQVGWEPRNCKSQSLWHVETGVRKEEIGCVWDH